MKRTLAIDFVPFGELLEKRPCIENKSSEEIVLQFLEHGDEYVKVEQKEGYYVPGQRLNALMHEYCVRYHVKPLRHVTKSLLAQTKLSIRRSNQQVCRICMCRTVTRDNHNAHLQHNGEHLYCHCGKRTSQTERRKLLVFENVVMHVRTDDSSWNMVDFHFPLASASPTQIVPLPTVVVRERYPNHQVFTTDSEQADLCSQLIARHIARLTTAQRVLLLCMKKDRSTPVVCAPHVLQSMTWEQAAQRAYSHENSLWYPLEMENLICSNATWVWHDSFDLVIVFSTEQMTQTTFKFLKLLLQSRDTSSRSPALWFFGHAYFSSCAQPAYTTTNNPNESNPRYMLLAKELFRDQNPYSWHLNIHLHSCTRAISRMCEPNTTPYIETLRSMILEEEMPKREPMPENHQRFDKLFGTVLPLAYRNRGTNLRTHFGVTSLRHIKTWIEFRDWKMRFETCCKRKEHDISGEERALLYLCTYVDKNALEKSLLEKTSPIMHTDWLTNWLRCASVHFEAIGLQRQEFRVHKDHYLGYIDGFTTEGAVVELKLCKKLLFEHKLQVMLYHCMYKMDHFDALDYCVLYNYRTGDMLRLRLQPNVTAEAFFQRAVQVCNLTGGDRDFLNQHR